MLNVFDEPCYWQQVPLQLKPLQRVKKTDTRNKNDQSWHCALLLVVQNALSLLFPLADRFMFPPKYSCHIPFSRARWDFCFQMLLKEDSKVHHGKHWSLKSPTSCLPWRHIIILQTHLCQKNVTPYNELQSCVFFKIQAIIYLEDWGDQNIN